MEKIAIVYHRQQFGDTRVLAEALAEGPGKLELKLNLLTQTNGG